MSVLVEFAMFPTDKGESVSSYVARVLDIIDKSGLDYLLTPMGTIIEAESLDEVFKVIKESFEALQKDCNRIIINMKVDYRKGKSGRIKTKVKSVEEKAGKVLSTI